MAWTKDSEIDIVVGGNQGMIQISSTPSGASVTINGQLANKVTPFSILGDPDTYVVVVSKDGYESCSNSVTLSVGQTIPIACTLMPISGGDFGTLEVITTPTGAEVYVDENAVGTTYYNGSEAVGSHQLRLHLEGYSDKTQTINISKDQTTSVTWTFTQAVVQAGMGWVLGLGLAGAFLYQMMKKKR